MSLIKLFCDQEECPSGIDNKKPVFSWYVQSEKNNLKQCSYSIQVAGSKEELHSGQHLAWDRICESDEMRVRYAGNPLRSDSTYYWKVSVVLSDGERVQSEPARFDTAFLDVDCWKAKWIMLPDSKKIPDKPVLGSDGNAKEISLEHIRMTPAYQIRKDISIEKQVKSAWIFMTAHGIYQLFIDGKRIGDHELAPGHSRYSSRLLYQRYEVGEELTEGSHTIAVILADGWYAGRIGFAGDDCQYGDTLALLLQMEIDFTDGTKEWFGTDDSFQYMKSAYQYADLFVGEKYDANLYLREFFIPGYMSGSLRNIEIMEEGYSNLRAQVSNRIRVTEVIPYINVWEEQGSREHLAKSMIVDFGTVLAGKFKAVIRGEKNREIRFECSEILDQDGKFVCNVKEPYKNQTDIYICAGGAEECYEPMFTYHGFRYIKITGLNSRDDLLDIQALVLTSEMRRTGEFSCSDERLTQLQKNILRSQISNMVSIPTDCPQREKAGWAGDVQVFAPTACFNEDMRNFFDSWLEDVRREQSEDGQIPIIIPYLNGYQRVFEGIFSSAGWGDVAVILPWVMYNYYGDKTILQDNFEMMEKWIGYIRHTAETENPEQLQNCTGERAEHLKYIWNTNFHFGDWLTPSASLNLETGAVDMMQSAYLTMDIVPTLFYYYSTILIAGISEILGQKDKQRYYAELAEKVKAAFCYEYVDEQGNIKSNLQGIHVLAIQFGILRPEMEQKAAARLKELIIENNGKLDTGFLSVPYILDVLKKNKENVLLYQILLNEECPSWLYEIKKGATSMWESWQAVMPDGRSSFLSMNHYSIGCVGDWMYRNLAGIQMGEPGYRRIRIAPDLQAPLEWVKGKYHSIYGDIRCEWTHWDERIQILVEVPVNTEAEIVLEEVISAHILQDSGNAGYEFAPLGKEWIARVPSGKYRMEAKLL